MPKKSQAQKKLKEIKKTVEDKTFGMKNKKKSKKVQNFIKQAAGKERGGFEKMQQELHEEKKKKKKRNEEKKMLLGVFTQTAPKKEKKAQGAKIDIYTDQRDAMFGNTNSDTIDNWDQQKLDEAVNYNAKKYQATNQTSKICKFFLEAIEKKKYGWFWVCPNGYNCIYRHCLPPDYVFKNDKQPETEEKKDDNIAQQIDAERDKLDGKKLTPVTKELFFKWLKKRQQRLAKDRKDRIQEDLKEKGYNIKKKLVTGRELFEKDKTLFTDADDAVGEYEREEQVDVDENVFGDEELPDF